VISVIKGSPPSVITVPLADVCLAHFQTLGERVIVAGIPHNSPLTLTDRQAASLRRRGFGDWSEVR
jgi:hypothetical protein